jgi:hypothetical protein
MTSECSRPERNYTRLGTVNAFLLVVYPALSGGRGAVSDLSQDQQLPRLAREALLVQGELQPFQV